MIDVLGIGKTGGEGDFRMLDVVVKVGGYLLAVAVVVVEMAQLDAEDGCLQLVDPGVAATIVEDIFA